MTERETNAFVAALARIAESRVVFDSLEWDRYLLTWTIPAQTVSVHELADSEEIHALMSKELGYAYHG